MFCPYCGTFNTEESTACCRCGGTFRAAPVAQPATEAPRVTEPAPKKGRVWPPLLVLVVLLAIGLTLFFLIPLTGSSVTDPAMPWFTMRDGVLYFDDSAYIGGSELTVPAAIMGQKVTAISDGCFSGCEWMTAVFLPEGLLSVGDGAFENCTALRGIRLPETLRSLGDEAFAGCEALEAVCIPYATQDLGSDIFRGCGSLMHIFYPATKEEWSKLKLDSIGKNTRIYCVDGVVSGG